jgi:hypothetical protein
MMTLRQSMLLKPLARKKSNNSDKIIPCRLKGGLEVSR